MHEGQPIVDDFDFLFSPGSVIDPCSVCGLDSVSDPGSSEWLESGTELPSSISSNLESDDPDDVV